MLYGEPRLMGYKTVRIQENHTERIRVFMVYEQMCDDSEDEITVSVDPKWKFYRRGHRLRTVKQKFHTAFVTYQWTYDA